MPEYVLDGKLVEFLTKDKLILHGFLAQAAGSKTCIIFVHGMTGSFYDTKLSLVLAERAKKRDISTFIINTRGHDAVAVLDRKTNRTQRKYRTLLAGTDFEKFEDCLFDIEGAINTLDSMGFRRFILAGHSTGCQKITYYQYKKKDRRVAALVLFGAAEDYPDKQKRQKSFRRLVALSKALVRKRRGNLPNEKLSHNFSAKRFLSVADLRSAEARIFNYGGPMREFGSVKAPILAVFGSREENLTWSVKKHLDMLKEKTGSRAFGSVIIGGAKHSFRKHEAETAKAMLDWIDNNL